VGGQGSADDEFNLPQGLEIDDDGDIWVCDRLNTALKEFDSSGNFLSKIEGGNPMIGLTDVLPNSDGSFFLTIWGGSYTGVRKFDAAGMVLDESLIFQSFQALSQAPDGVLYVVASGPANRVYEFDPTSLDFLINWGGFGFEDQNLNQPYDIDLADNGKIYVTDSENHLIKVFENPIFADGFESGDTTAWDASVQ